MKYYLYLIRQGRSGRDADSLCSREEENLCLLCRVWSAGELKNRTSACYWSLICWWVKEQPLCLLLEFDLYCWICLLARKRTSVVRKRPSASSVQFNLLVGLKNRTYVSFIQFYLLASSIITCDESQDLSCTLNWFLHWGKSPCYFNSNARVNVKNVLNSHAHGCMHFKFTVNYDLLGTGNHCMCVDEDHHY